LQELHGAAVAQDVGVDAFAAQGGTVFGCCGGVSGDPQGDGVAAEPPAGAGGPSRV